MSTHIGTSVRTRTFIRKSPTYEATANNNNNHKFRGIFRGRFSFSLYIIFSIRFFFRSYSTLLHLSVTLRSICFFFSYINFISKKSSYVQNVYLYLSMFSLYLIIIL